MSKQEVKEGSELLQEQVKLLYGGIPNSLLANFFGSIVAVLVFSGEVAPGKLYGWAGALLAVTVVRFFHYRYYRSHTLILSDVNRWYTQFKIGTFVLAAIVGSAGVLLYVEGNPGFEVTLALMMICIASFAITTISPRRRLVICFLLVILLPVMGALLFSDSEVSSYVFWMMSVLLVLLLVSASRISNTITHSIKLTLEAEQREEALRQSQQRLSLYIKETPLAVIEWDLDFQVIDWNPAAQKIFGYSEQEARGKKASELIVETDTQELVSSVWDQLMENVGGYQSINENLRKDGKVITCEWFNTPLIDSAGRVIGVMSLAQDVTQRMETEKARDEFISIVSHELRTPVTSIKGSLGLLATGIFIGDPEKTKELVDVALINTNRLHLLLNDILDVEKIDSDKVDYRFRETDLVSLINDVIRANNGIANTYNISVECMDMPETVTVSIDPDRMFQVVTNVLSNAIKFSFPGESVRISLSLSASHAKVCINNRGEVIPDSDRELIFDKFVQRDSSDTRSKEGSGLGLYICQKILERHESSLMLESNAEEGTTFYFSLPLDSGAG